MTEGTYMEYVRCTLASWLHRLAGRAAPGGYCFFDEFYFEEEVRRRVDRELEREAGGEC